MSDRVLFKIRRGKANCWYRSLRYPQLWQDRDPTDTCPLCKKGFLIGTPVYMINTNSDLFPYCVIHQSCVDTDLLITTHALMKSYDRIKKVIDENPGWSLNEFK